MIRWAIRIMLSLAVLLLLALAGGWWLLPHLDLGPVAGRVGGALLGRDLAFAGLKVVPYTFRPENAFLPRDLQQGGEPATRSDAGSVREMRAFLDAGVDGFFTDDPALGRQAVDGWRKP